MCCFFFFNDTATTEIYTLSLHDALPIYRLREQLVRLAPRDHGGHRLVRRPVDLAPRDLPGRDLEDHALHLTADPRRPRAGPRGAAGGGQGRRRQLVAADVAGGPPPP